MIDPHQRERFYMRLGKNKRDRKLAGFISADRQHGVNISRLMKQLLYNYYTGSPLPHYQGPETQQPDDDSRQSSLSAKLQKLNFDTLAQG